MEETQTGRVQHKENKTERSASQEDTISEKLEAIHVGTFWHTHKLSPAETHCNARYASAIHYVQRMDQYLQDITGWRMKMCSVYPPKGHILVSGHTGVHESKFS